MILFEKYKNNNQHSAGFGKYYGRVKMIETVEIEKIAKYMQESCTVKVSDVVAVLNELGPTIARILQESKRVRIPSLGCFKVGAATKGEADKDKWTCRDNVKKLRIIFQPETETLDGGGRVKKLLQGATMGDVETVFGLKESGQPEGDEGEGDGD